MILDEADGGLARPRGAIWRRIFILALVCGGLVALALSGAPHAALLKVLSACEQVISRHPVIGAILFVAFAAVAALVAFVSAAIIVPVAVVTWGEPLTMLLLWIGWILGGVLAYSIGRLPGRAFAKWFAGNGLLQRLESFLATRTSFGMIVLVQLTLPSEILGYLVGMLRYPLRRYLLALALCELPYAVATVNIGAGLVERRSGPILIAGLGLIVLTLTALAILKARVSRGR